MSPCFPTPARTRRLRHFALNGGWSILCLCAPAVGLGQSLTTGPSYYFHDARAGASGTPGSDATGNHGCASGPYPGTAGSTGPTINDLVTITLQPLDYRGTLVAASSSGGAGGRGANGDPHGHCGKGDFDARAGGAGGSVVLKVNPGAHPASAAYRLTSTGVVAVSHGGDGGDGGYNTRGKSQYRGGEGAGGGAGGPVNLENNVALQVSGGLAVMGLVAQSGGGAGGAGGGSVGGASAGSGRPGGPGGAVSVLNTAAISTDGGNAISAQSIGGFGGDGGVNTNSHSGSGATGGDGGSVSVDNRGALVVGLSSRPNCSETVTSACNPAGSFGMAAQSVGAGGGHAGASAGTHVLGAEGGDAGHGAPVSISNSGTVAVLGPNGTGVFAQAIGGGGGSGGMAIASGRHATAVGGAGGDGGNGAAVTLQNWNSVCTGLACIPGHTGVADDTSAGSAVALLAQSIGGGGGLGAYARAKGKTNSIFGNSSASAVGGTGGGGGRGDLVVLANGGALSTVEISSPAVLAQSIGGGGGSAGGAVAYATALAGDASAVSHGGSGGGGGSGGAVLVNCSSYSSVATGFSACAGHALATAPQPAQRISTAGIGSPGIVAQSIGGGGGAGGYAMSLAGSLIGSQAFGFGGSGGVAGSGGAVFASSNGLAISTGGLQSPGLLAQSIGGGGGSGGSTIDLSLAYVGSSVSVGVGGKGGSGQLGGAVRVHNPGGVISTAGDGSQGLVAQSIGGGGGNGGSAISFAASGSYAAAVAVGGNGASGGTGGAVSLINEGSGVNAAYGSGDITTHGQAASALLAQSIGGGGGNGGYTVALSGALYLAGAAAIGGSGGAGNHAGPVDVTNRSALSTTGGGAAVLLAQSIGGGGGAGGYAYAGSLAQIGAVSIGRGGSGGAGANAGAVNVSNSGSISATATASGNAPGILAQSLGGGGGTGGFSAAGVAAMQLAASLAIGGGGGNGGTGGAISVDNAADVFTRGAFSPAIQGQSLGGNGGNGGYTLSGALAGGVSLAVALGGGGGRGGTASDVNLNVHGSSVHSITTDGGQSPGLVAQSLGGSGGSGGWAVSASASMLAAPAVSLGGSGGGGGRAGQALVSSGQAVHTAGLMSPGVLAQSIGGSGGSGGFSAAASVTSVVALSTAVGGPGGSGGTANTARVDATAPIRTQGDLSMGIVAQSIGGNGGNGGSAMSGSASTGNPASAVSVGAAGAAGATGGTGQAGGTVSIHGRHTVQTTGLAAMGIVAQSIGGGGGNGGATAAFSASASGGDPNSKSLAAAVTVGGKGAAGGAGGAVTVLMPSAVQTGAPQRSGLAGGDRAVGVLAQSVGGSGGQGGAAYSNAIAGSAAVAVAVGGGGGAGSNAGTVGLNFDALTYIASHPDLIRAYGNNPASGLQHFISTGVFEGRDANGFNAAQYLANHANLQATYGSDLAAATQHYVVTGYQAGLTDRPLAGASLATLPAAATSGTFVNPLTYIASFPDLIQAFGSNPVSGLQHYLSYGFHEGRNPNGFNAAQYLANHADLRAVYGNDQMAATAHYITTGHAEGRSDRAPAGSTPAAAPVAQHITTFGHQAPALVAQSVGGGGGSGGASSASATSNKHSASVAVGGYGAGGGNAGSVVLTSAGALTTAGAQSPAVLAQSVGGGGGHGGSASASAAGAQGAVLAAGVAAYTGLVGNTVGKATVAVAKPFTKDDGAKSSSTPQNDNGAGASLSIGGAGGLGGAGSTVTVDNGAAITTLGDLSSGVFAQSVGGGGGHGGSSTSNATGGNASAAISLGGSGGTGGDAAAVTVKNSNHITTAGVQALGVFAQSVGGGGGSGGAASSTASAGGKAAASFGLGGSGGGGGVGGSVNLINLGHIGTSGSHAAGLMAQSVGGGGGNGGAASTAASVTSAGNSGNTSASTGTASSAPNNSSNSASAGSVPASGSTPASKGGAAGADSGYAASLAIGGAGGRGSSGGTVLVQHSGSVSTGLSVQPGVPHSVVNAPALMAQSIGGGGGNGGSSSSNADAAKSSVALSLGGIGAGAGSGGAVSVYASAGTLDAKADLSAGLFAQSVGGGGGSGGSASSTTGQGSSASVALGLGGAAGGGGHGGNVLVCGLHRGDGGCGSAMGSGISTAGVQSPGVFAQSVGGGGGSGGAVSTAATAGSGSGSDNSATASGGSTSSSASSGVAVAAALGGSGGSGGNGGSVTTNLDAPVSTSGAQSAAVFAQSVGGGGGVAGNSSTNANSGAYALSLALGASGGSGGKGGGIVVDVGSSASLLTSGDLSYGLLAQSIGGGGGLAGNTSSTSAGTGNGSLSLALGGRAGSGQDGGSVQVRTAAPITTRGFGADAVLAQSIGGGGGSGGAATGSASSGRTTATLALGGAGGAAGQGLDVSVSYQAAINTQGDMARGVLAQSIGGGGGVGAALSAGLGGGAFSGTMRLGGTGGDGGRGGRVGVDAAHDVSTAGVLAQAVVAQSIGGGGGFYGHTHTGSPSSAALNFTLGAAVGNSNDSSASTVNLGAGRISTAGAGSHGVLAQSIGGGGGAFAWAQPTGAGAGGSFAGSVTGQLGISGGVGKSDSVVVNGAPVVATSGLQAAGLVAQSISGGGGLALAAAQADTVFSGTVTLGATGGSATYTGTSSVTLTGGSLSTGGDMAPALVAQSIGGGGGLSLMRAGSVVLGGKAGGSAYPSDNLKSAAAVTVTNRAAISTSGAGSIGIVAQSIGNGGGLAYAQDNATLGAGGSGGHGGAVRVDSNATIHTSGVNAFGILAQSVGGGGGAVLSTGNALAGRLVAGSGNAGDVTVNVNAAITTTGAGAHGVVVQSVRGGGGIVVDGSTTRAYGGSLGTSGLVTVNVPRGIVISATGPGARGIWGASSTDPIVDIAPGAAVVGGSGGVALYFEGPINALRNQGTVSTTDGHSGLAVHTVGGDIAITNSGLLHGNLQLAAGADNQLHNQAGGRLVHGGTLDLGGSGTLRNDGVIAHGGALGAVTRIDGAFVQGSEGTLTLRLDHAQGLMDTLEVTGAARLHGTLHTPLVNAHRVAPGTQALGTIISASQGLDASGLSMADTAILSFQLHHHEGAIGVSATADFSPEGMNEDVQRLGDLLGTAQGEERANFQALTARLVALRTPQELHQTYWELSGAGATTVATVGTRLSTVFGRQLVDRVGARPAARPAGQAGHSAWGQALGETHAARSDGSAGTAHVDARLGGVAVGADTRLDAHTTLGLAMGGADTRLQMSHGYRASGRAVQLGVYGAREFGGGQDRPDGGPELGHRGHYVAGALTYARHHLDTERLFEPTGAQYRARMEGYSVGARAELGWRVALPSLGVAPYAALQLQRYVMRAHSEEASSQPHLALHYGRGAYSQLRTELGAALDSRHALQTGAVFSLRGRLAWAHEAWTEQRMHAAFQTLHAQPFSVVGVTPVSDLAVLAALAELQLSARLAVALNLQGEFGRRTQTRAGAASLRYRW